MRTAQVWYVKVRDLRNLDSEVIEIPGARRFSRMHRRVRHPFQTIVLVFQIEQLEPEQLAAWISAAPEPQRSALALYYLDEFSYRELMSLLGIKLGELAHSITSGRREFQAWLNFRLPVAK